MDSVHIVTGGTGFLGRHLVRALLKRKASVLVLVRNISEASDILGTDSSYLKFIKGDITDKEWKIDPDFYQGKKLYFWHLAANLSFSKNEKKEAYKTNIEGTDRVLHFVQSYRNATLIYMSTAYVCGKSCVFSSSQEYGAPRNTYEATKQIAEKRVLESSVRAFVLRPSIVLGEAYEGKGKGCTFGYYRFAYIFTIFKNWLKRKLEIQDLFGRWLQRYGTKYDEKLDQIMVPFLRVPIPNRSSVHFVDLEDVLRISLGCIEEGLEKNQKKILLLTHTQPLLVKDGFEVLLTDMGFEGCQMIKVPPSVFRMVAYIASFFPSPWQVYARSTVSYLPYMTREYRFEKSTEHDSLNLKKIDKSFLKEVNKKALDYFR